MLAAEGGELSGFLAGLERYAYYRAFGAACVEHVPSIVGGLTEIRKAIETSKRFVDTLPFFARGFAEQDFTSGTGMSYGEWFRILDSVIERLNRLSSLPTGELGSLTGDCRKLAAHLERYAQYLETIPGKLRMAASFIQLDEQTLKNVEEAPRFAGAVRELKQALEALASELEARAGS